MIAGKVEMQPTTWSHALVEQHIEPEVTVSADTMTKDETIRLQAAEIEELRELLRDARDDVAECMGQETKPHRIEAYKVQLAAIDEALGD